MDQNTLVSSGQALVKAMDEAGFSPRIAMWVHDQDVETWKLWLIPPAGFEDKADFYRRMAGILAANRNELGGIEISDVKMIAENHPAMQGLARFIQMSGLGSAYFPGNVFNGFYLPDGIILRSDLGVHA